MLGSDASHVHEYTPVAGNLGIGPWIVFVRGVAKEPGERVERPGDSAVDTAPASRRGRLVSLVAGRLRFQARPQRCEPGRVVVVHGRCQYQTLSLGAQSEQPPRMKCCLRRKAEQALFDIHYRIVDRGRPPMPGSGVRARAGNTGVVSIVDAAMSRAGTGMSGATVVLAVTQASRFLRLPGTPETRFTEWCEVKSGSGEEAVEEAGPVLHPPEPRLHQRGQLADIAFSQVGQGSFQVRPHRFHRGSARGRTAGAGRRSASPGRRPARPSRG
jgi:hypothetical protein